MKKLFYLFVVVTLFITSCMKNETQNDQSAGKKERMQAFYDQVMNAHNVAMLDSFTSADFNDHQADPHYPKGMDGLRAAFTDFFNAYPDLHVKTNFMMASGDTVMAHVTMTGTNSGSMMGMPPTNKQINIDGVDIVVIKDGKAVEHWGYQEENKMMTQRGLMPPMGPGPDSMHTVMEEKK